MATIEIPDSLIPEGYEPDGGVRKRTVPAEAIDEIHITVLLRRKPPKLKAIVFEVAGEARTCKAGEWVEDGDGIIRRATGLTPIAFVPFTRREVYEGDDDAAI